MMNTLTAKMKSNTVQTYLNEIARHRLLTADEEILLGKRVQRMMELRKKEGPLSSSEKRELRLGERAFERFVRSNLRLVVDVAKKYARTARSLDFMDLIQEGNIGLMRGVEKFDPARGYKFSTYAYWWIRQSITRTLSSKDRMIRLPTTVADMASKWSRTVVELSNMLGREPKPVELAEVLGVKVEEVLTYIHRGACNMVSLDGFYSVDGDTPLMDLIADPRDPDGQEAVEKLHVRQHEDFLDAAMRTLEFREADILRRRWGIGPYEQQSLAEIGRRYDISRERVRQVVQNAERKIKYRMTQLGARRDEVFEPA